MASASITVRTAAEVLGERGTRPGRPAAAVLRSPQVAAELFYGPGGATRRALHELYDVLELTAPALPRPDQRILRFRARVCVNQGVA